MAKHAGGGAGVGGSPPGHDLQKATPSAGPRHAASARAGARRVVGLALVALLAVTTVVVVSRLNSATADRATAKSTSATTTASVATGAPTTGVPSTSGRSAPLPMVGTVPATLTGPLPGPLPQTGPGLTQPGILLIASPTSDGSFDVLERIRLASPVNVLTLRPAAVDRAGRQFASASAAASQVQISAGGEPVVIPGAKLDAGVDLAVVEVDQFELRYRLADVTVRSTPSAAGRALAAIGPLTAGVDEDLPVRFIVAGSTILGLSCPLLPLSEQSCGSRVDTGTGVESELPWRLALTSVQFNLPAA